MSELTNDLRGCAKLRPAQILEYRPEGRAVTTAARLLIRAANRIEALEMGDRLAALERQLRAVLDRIDRASFGSEIADLLDDPEQPLQKARALLETKP